MDIRNVKKNLSSNIKPALPRMTNANDSLFKSSRRKIQILTHNVFMYVLSIDRKQQLSLLDGK